MKLITFTILLSISSLSWSQAQKPNPPVLASAKAPLKDRAKLVTVKYDERGRPEYTRQLNGNGTRGGGESVVINGRAELRDLHDKSTCSWVAGEDLYQKTPYAKVIIENIAKVDWYFAETLKQEIFALDYCLTEAELIRVPTEDPDGLTTIYMENTQQVAIRLYDSVYIDDVIFRLMGPRSKGYLLVHEALHSFIPWRAPMRNEKLRSMVKGIEGLETGRISTRSAFHVQLTRNDVQFPLTVAQLDGVKKEVLFILSDFPKQREILMASADVELFLQRVRKIPQMNLSSFHAPWVSELDLQYVVSGALFNDDVALLEKLISPESLREDVIALVYINHVPESQPRVSEWVKGQTGIDRLIDATLGHLANRAITIENGRVSVDGQRYLGLFEDENDLMAMRSLNATEFFKMKGVLQAYFNTLVKALKENDLSYARSLTVNDERFYQAFGIVEVAAKIKALDTDDVTKDRAIRKARVMAVAVWKAVEGFIEDSGALKNWNKIKKEIDTNKLGYTI